MAKPWSLNAWRLVLLAVDCAALMLLALLLAKLKLPVTRIAVYWWNPLIIKEIYNSGHMDLLLVPVLAGAVLLALNRRHVMSAALLACGAGIKVWPVLLLPLVLAPLLKTPRKLLAPAAAFVLITAIMSLPVFAGGLGVSSGFSAYSRMWEMNDALYMLVYRGAGLFTGNSATAHLATRTLAVLFLLGLVAFLSIRGSRSNMGLPVQCLAVSSALFIVSPTQFPWYFVWIIPFLVLVPFSPLLLFTALLPVYYTRFYFSSHGMTDIFDNGIVWIEFVPVWLLLIREYVLYRRRSGRFMEMGRYEER